MGRDLATQYAEARVTFEEADDVLGVSLSQLMWEGPEESLTATHNAQPAILTLPGRVPRARGTDRAGFVRGRPFAW